MVKEVPSCSFWGMIDHNRNTDHDKEPRGTINLSAGINSIVHKVHDGHQTCANNFHIELM